MGREGERKDIGVDGGIHIEELQVEVERTKETLVRFVNTEDNEGSTYIQGF